MSHAPSLPERWGGTNMSGTGAFLLGASPCLRVPVPLRVGTIRDEPPRGPDPKSQHYYQNGRSDASGRTAQPHIHAPSVHGAERIDNASF